MLSFWKMNYHYFHISIVRHFFFFLRFTKQNLERKFSNHLIAHNSHLIKSYLDNEFYMKFLIN